MTSPSRSADPPRRPGTWRLVATVAVAYAAGSAVSFALFSASDVGAVLFPPAGVTLAALVLTRPRDWPWVLATVIVVEIAIDIAYGLPLVSVVGFVLANTVEPLVGAVLLRRFAPDLDLRRRRDLGLFIACAVVAGPFVGAFVGATTNDLALARDWFAAFLPFWAGDGLGVLVVAGAVLSWWSGPHPAPLGTALNRLLLVAVTVAGTTAVFWSTTVPLAYLTFPLLLVFAFRYGAPAVALTGLAATLTANVVTAAGRGPWAETAGSPNAGHANLQLFLAVAVLTAWLLAVEIEERQRASTVSLRETALRRRVEALQEVTAGLATAATTEAIAQVLVRRGRGLVADRAAVGLVSPDGTRLRTWTAGADGPVPGELALDAPALLATVVRRGSAVSVSTPDELRAHFPGGLAGEAAGAAGGAAGTAGEAGAPPGQLGSALAVPAQIGEVTVGALAFGFSSGSGVAVDADVPAVAGTLAELMAQALLRARLYEKEHAAAHQLQRAFLPVVPDHRQGMDVAGCYRPADQEHDVGGDWYDVFGLPDGRTAFVVGDVVGHDLPAAAAMGRLHAALRVIAGGRHAGPRQVLEALDEACPGIPGAEFATLGYGEYDPVTCTLRYACAGHPPPLLVERHRARYLMEGRSTPLAVTDGPRTEAELVVPPGAMLLWYSDGLVERRGSDLDAGMERLAAVAATLDGGDVATWRDVVMTELTGGRPLQDDAVLLCLHLRGTGRDRVDGVASSGQAGPHRRGLRLVADDPAR
jgi:integral membrane sensor domain MASE1